MKPRSDPKRHHRRSIRLPGYDYRQPGAYFVTICTYQRELLFVDPALRQAAETVWRRVPLHFPHVELDEWVVMPNHIHGIVVIVDVPHGRGEASQVIGSHAKSVPVSAIDVADATDSGDASPLQHRPSGVKPGSLGAIVGNFEAVATQRINRLRHTTGMPVWQRNCYEHIARDEETLNAIRQYITDNPTRWAWDTYNPDAVGPDPQAADLWRLLQEESR